MWRSRKLILMALLAIVLLGAIVGGVAFAQAQNGDESQPVDQRGALLDRVCQIYEQKTGVAIDRDALKDSFAQAERELQAEALQNRLQKLVDQGTITQEQADQYLQWWQSRPDVPLPGPQGPMCPEGPRFRGHGFPGKMWGQSEVEKNL